jgi:mycothiol synthase
VVGRSFAATHPVRPATAADLSAIAALGHAAIDGGDFPDATHGDVERSLASLAAEPDSAFVAVEDGRVVGYLAPRLNDLCVDAAHRRRGHATALVDAAVPYVRDVLGHPYLLLYVPPGDGPGRSFAEARGFTYRASLFWMERPASEACPTPGFPAGVAWRPWDPGRDQIPPFVDLLNATFADHPTPVSWTEPVIRAAHAAPDFDPDDILLVAPAGEPDRPVAFCRARLYPDEEKPYGEVKLIGVLPPWRGRGLGRALLRWGVRHLQDRGVPTISLAVSAANEHALRMYEAHGFRRAVEWPQWSRNA